MLDEDDQSFVDIYVENEPIFKIVFNFKKSNAFSKYAELSKFVKGSDLESYLVVNYVNTSLSDLKYIKENVLNIFNKGNIDTYKVYIDRKLNKVVAQVLPYHQIQVENTLRRTLTSRISKEINMISSDLSDFVIIENLKSELNFTAWGGGRLYSSNQALCTTGFSVKNSSNILGLSTASHCAASNYWYTVTSANKLTLVSRVANKDVAWFRTPSTINPPPEAKILVGGNTYRNINGTQTVSVGNSVCKYGQTSGYSCGIVTALGVTASMSGVSVTNLIEVTKNGKHDGGAITEQGDSGGPLFVTTNGITKATGTAVAGAGNLGDLDSYFATVASITAMGVTILVK